MKANVDIILTAKTSAGEDAIRRYHEEKLGVIQKASLRARGITASREVVSENPLVHVTKISIVGKEAAVFNERFSMWLVKNALLFETKLLEYGANREDYVLAVRR